MSTNDSHTTSGRRIILAVFGGIALFAIIGLVSYRFFSPKQEPCANGALALNPESQPGVTLPREDTMNSIEDAETFICHDVAYPRDPSLMLQKITAFRQSSLQDVVESNAYAEVRMTYLHRPTGQTVQVNTSPYDLGPPKSTSESKTIRIGAQEALETRGGPSPDYVQVDWVANGLAFHVQTQLSGGMTEDTLDSLLDSIR